MRKMRRIAPCRPFLAQDANGHVLLADLDKRLTRTGTKERQRSKPTADTKVCAPYESKDFGCWCRECSMQSLTVHLQGSRSVRLHMSPAREPMSGPMRRRILQPPMRRPCLMGWQAWRTTKERCKHSMCCKHCLNKDHRKCRQAMTGTGP